MSKDVFHSYRNDTKTSAFHWKYVNPDKTFWLLSNSEYLRPIADKPVLQTSKCDDLRRAGHHWKHLQVDKTRDPSEIDGQEHPYITK
eukprot:11992000-Karenia_brevis.AAC.1